MRTVLILGAGASVSEAVHFRPIKRGKHPPVDATFFRRAMGNADAAMLETVARQAAEVGQSNLFDDDPPVSLEQHLGRIYWAMRKEGTAPSRRAYYDLVRLYQAELLMTTNWMIGRRGMLRELLQAELKTGASVTILTFNHDLLAENALEQLPRRRHAGAWCLRHVYGLEFSENISSRDEAFEPECTDCEDTLVRVLKLHGSLNWVFRTLKTDPPADLGRGKRKLFLWTNKRLPERPGAKLHTEKGRDWYLWPLIVPPVYEKHGLLRDELNQVWRMAGEEVMRADKAIFWGYSFPSVDLHARYFFDQAANENSALRTPILINPAPEATASLWEALRPRSVRHYRHIGHCLDQEYA